MSTGADGSETPRALADLVEGRPLTDAQVAQVVGEFMDGQATPARIAAFLTALRMKGETAAEVVGAARAMRARMTRVACPEPAVDVCGTGGDGSGSVNVSTLSALVVAACGVTVAKHGNRALSSRSGSHDVIEALGLHPAPGAELAARCLREVGLAFLFAPVFHAATRNVAAVRRELGFRTVFNLLGPLTNPAGVRHHVNGVFAADRLELVAQAHLALGSARALVVHGAGGLDEFATAGPTEAAELRDGQVRRLSVRPADFGLPEADPAGLRGGAPEDNARILRATLDGQPGAVRNAALMTAAAALYVVGRAASLREGAGMAAEALDGGHAAAVLTRLCALAPRAAVT